MLALLNADPEWLPLWLHRSYLAALPWLLLALAAIAAIALAIARFTFMLDHKMTREEVQQELQTAE